MGDDRPNVYVEDDGLVVYRASALGGCPVSLARARQGFTPMPFPEKFGEYFARGNEIEEIVLMELAASGWFLGETQEEVQLLLIGGNPATVVRGHIDATGTGPDGYKRLVEIKATNSAYFKELEAKGFGTPGLMQKYLWQTSVYMTALELEGVLVFRNWEDDNPLTNTAYFYMEKPHYTRLQLMERVMQVEKWVADDTVPVECNVYEYPCPFYYLHPPEDREEVDAEEAEEIGRLAEEYDRLGKKIGSDTKRRKDVATGLLERLGERDRIEATGYRVTRYVGSHKELDRTQFTVDYPTIDIDSYFRSVPNASPSLRVTPGDAKRDRTTEGE